ncbi:16S rRNA (uracil(1498)-N(3))-methyltransferase [Nocardioides marmorisolisilvae]|uniref:Ribosomal RNA small subunit methyltransferase E n=1 Tax=Nocardioides marmorisolisilvae TaxID=1542737 RepID=A0A3N0DTA2_9ACTN|nr:16S rRNA (uracil(1498)-N(3))-methyltransferase [Nocardioides marmorisolisilvae]RNL78874.1 16S rRNA (uracil(1498)-N(3))-methyltransferase [Nocardioides marmorisolisilvae]
MTLPAFLSDAVGGAAVGASVLLDGDEGRHAATVKRIRVGEQVVLTDGSGTSAVCSVTGTAKSSLTLSVVSTSFAERATPTITVVQALPKGDRGELAVEVLTEIDVDRIVPWAASRSVAVWKGERAAKGLAKWRATAREATKQARRSWLPEVAELTSTAEVAALIGEVDVALVLHEDAEQALAEVSFDGASSVLVVVGPEGGISDEELAAFEGARAVRLGSSVLRTSTAGVAAVAAILSRTDRWR